MQSPRQEHNQKKAVVSFAMIENLVGHYSRVLPVHERSRKFSWPVVPSSPEYLSTDPYVVNICDARETIWNPEKCGDSAIVAVCSQKSLDAMLVHQNVMVIETEESFEKIVNDIVGLFQQALNNSSNTSSLLDSQWTIDASPYRQFFIGLIEGKHMDSAYVIEQMQLSRLDTARGVLLLVFKGSGFNQKTRDRIAQEASKIANGNNHMFVYKGDLLVLAYTDSKLIWAELGGRAMAPLDLWYLLDIGVRAGTSGVLSNLRFLDKAYLQALVGIKYHDLIVDEMLFSSPVDPMPICPFAFTIPYYAMNDPSLDQSLIELYFQNSPAEQVYQEDMELGTNITRVIWTYLCLNCNASATAEKLFMHRNSVYNYVKRYSEDFGCDFSIIHLRNLTVLDFQHLFYLHGFKSVFERSL